MGEAAQTNEVLRDMLRYGTLGKPFWSEDVTAVRPCHGCKETRDRRAGVGRGSL